MICTIYRTLILGMCLKLRYFERANRNFTCIHGVRSKLHNRARFYYLHSPLTIKICHI
ncbi:hypothetical protein VCR4J2_250586 [Vibrio coralliirubri]|nr:hypothetical protein VCR4J2_250586 [Vibrio coralliirubri]